MPKYKDQLNLVFQQHLCKHFAINPDNIYFSNIIYIIDKQICNDSPLEYFLKELTETGVIRFEVRTFKRKENDKPIYDIIIKIKNYEKLNDNLDRIIQRAIRFKDTINKLANITNSSIHYDPIQGLILKKSSNKFFSFVLTLVQGISSNTIYSLYDEIILRFLKNSIEFKLNESSCNIKILDQNEFLREYDYRVYNAGRHIYKYKKFYDLLSESLNNTREKGIISEFIKAGVIDDFKLFIEYKSEKLDKMPDINLEELIALRAQKVRRARKVGRNLIQEFFDLDLVRQQDALFKKELKLRNSEFDKRLFSILDDYKDDIITISSVKEIINYFNSISDFSRNNGKYKISLRTKNLISYLDDEIDNIAVSKFFSKEELKTVIDENYYDEKKHEVFLKLRDLVKEYAIEVIAEEVENTWIEFISNRPYEKSFLNP